DVGALHDLVDFERLLAERFQNILPILSMSIPLGCAVTDREMRGTYYRKQVLLVEIGHDLGHQRAPFSCSRAVLEIIELPEHVAWRTTGDARQRSKPFQVGAVAQRALDCFARPTFHYQLRAFGEAPDRDICRKGRPRVAAF